MTKLCDFQEILDLDFNSPKKYIQIFFRFLFIIKKSPLLKAMNHEAAKSGGSNGTLEHQLRTINYPFLAYLGDAIAKVSFNIYMLMECCSFPIHTVYSSRRQQFWE